MSSEIWLCRKCKCQESIEKQLLTADRSIINYMKSALEDGTYGEGMAGERGRLSLQDLIDLLDTRRDRFGGDEEL
jgi:hypothetical protein